MRKDGETVHLTASDLVGHLNCRYLTALDLSGILSWKSWQNAVRSMKRLTSIISKGREMRYA
jgi:hypothetical protein